MRTLNDYFLTGQIDSAQAGGTVQLTVPDNGKIIKIMTNTNAAPTGGNCVATADINGDAVTGGVATIATGGAVSASAAPTAARDVLEGDRIGVVFGSAPTGGATFTSVTVVIRR